MKTPAATDRGILWLKLSTASQAALRAVVAAVHPNEFYHHLTLQYDVPFSSVETWAGQAASIEAYAVAHNDRAQAVRVRVNNLPDMYGVPHVTISTAHDVAPFESVAMLQGDHQEAQLAEPLRLDGTIEFVPLPG